MLSLSRTAAVAPTGVDGSPGREGGGAGGGGGGGREEAEVARAFRRAEELEKKARCVCVYTSAICMYACIYVCMYIVYMYI
jgi:hypothetical protein